MCSQFFSHPDVPLQDHLKEVAQRSEKIIHSLPLSNEKTLIAKASYIIGLSHDFGKYTSFFQRHLLKNEKVKGSEHSFLSALFAAWNLQLLKEVEILPLIGFFVVLRHHSDLSFPEDEIPPSRFLKDPPDFLDAPPKHRERLVTAMKQIADIKRNAYSEIKSFEVKEGLPNIDEFLNNGWVETLKELRSLWRKFANNRENLQKRIEIFWLTVLLYSVLIDSDKKSAAAIKPPPRKTIPFEIVDTYKRAKFSYDIKQALTSLRERVYESVLNNIEKTDLSRRLLSITAPTGAGKTLTALACALKLRERIEKEKGYSPRIIYVLPYINIIEQNYKVFQEVLALSICDFQENEGNYLIAHHHLAELSYKADEEEKSLIEAYHLIETWESEIIVTTAIQFFYSVLGYKNSFLRKFHNIVGSIILLDEVQILPMEYWSLLGKALSSLTEYFNCYLILLTATQPLILPPEKKIELVENAKENFMSLNRVKLRFVDKPIQKEELIEQLKEIYTPRNSYLLVVNTIPTSIEMYLEVKEKINPQNIFYLSTNIIPKQRKERIEKIKELISKNEKPFLVSTQVVEAGVDLDFDIAIRDIGPIDSLVQVAGRCNREGLKSEGKIFVFRLVNEAERVYRGIHISTTLEVLRERLNKGGEVIEESEFAELVEIFFTKAHDKVSSQESQDLWEALLELKFYSDQTSIKDFILIKEDIPEVEIFVEFDEKATRIWKEFQEIMTLTDIGERQEKFLKIKKELYDYIVAVPAERVKKNPPPKNGPFYFIPHQQLKEYYSEETGFIWERKTVIW